MNNERRNKISKIIKCLRGEVEGLEGVLEDENDARDNMPESLEGSERYAMSEECSDVLEDAIDGINEIIDSLEGII